MQKQGDKGLQNTDNIEEDILYSYVKAGTQPLLKVVLQPASF